MSTIVVLLSGTELAIQQSTASVYLLAKSGPCQILRTGPLIPVNRSSVEPQNGGYSDSECQKLKPSRFTKSPDFEVQDLREVGESKQGRVWARAGGMLRTKLRGVQRRIAGGSGSAEPDKASQRK